MRKHYGKRSGGRPPAGFKGSALDRFLKPNSLSSYNIVIPHNAEALWQGGLEAGLQRVSRAEPLTGFLRAAPLSRCERAAPFPRAEPLSGCERAAPFPRAEPLSGCERAAPFPRAEPFPRAAPQSKKAARKRLSYKFYSTNRHRTTRRRLPWFVHVSSVKTVSPS